jgi:3-deoxy-D-manno-octulosonic-acid transferase
MVGLSRTLVILALSVIVRWLVWPLVFVVAIFSDRVKEQLKGRQSCHQDSIDLARRRRDFDDCVIFYCSSAGEYEQAKPLIDRLTENFGVLCHVFFFSVSGPKFVKSRRDPVSWSLAPPDHVWAWASLFAALRPSKVVVIRHEIWPAFTWIAAQWGPVFVIDAVVPSLWGRQKKWKENLNVAVKAWLLKSVTHICAVSQTDAKFFEQWLFIPKERISVMGDTKYDRVIERARSQASMVDQLRLRFREYWKPPLSEFILIGGSVHLADVTLLMSVFAQPGLEMVRLLLVPHDVASGNIANIYEAVRKYGVSCDLLSEVESSQFEFIKEHPRVIIVDEMGRLSDLYGVADFAWIGGAVHAKVHNVLEPAAWGLPVCCGPQFKNSREAVAMKTAGVLFASSDPVAIRSHIIHLIKDVRTIGNDVRKFAESMAGASDKILKKIETIN